MGDQAFRAGARPVHIVRRAVLTAVPAVLAARAARAAAPRFPDDCHFLVAGPTGGVLAAWGDRLSMALRGDAAPIAIVTAGGADGVTGANQFATRVAPDGLTALLAPGAAALARLTGDPRAQFDPGAWLAVMAGFSSGVCVARSAIAEARAGTAVRVAAGGPAGPELPLLLGIELLGLRVEPVFGLGHYEAAARALGSGAVDAMFVHGPDSAAHLAGLGGSGAVAGFTLGHPSTAGWQRDPAIMTVPSLPELLAGRTIAPGLAEAWKAVATATQMEFGLMLQALSPATLVSQWRRAAETAADTLRDAVPDLRLLQAVEASAAVKMLTPDAPAIVELRRWLLARFKWQPE